MEGQKYIQNLDMGRQGECRENGIKAINQLSRWYESTGRGLTLVYI
jgi:hypothetical protein